ncbi:MAG: hypothetical protein R6W76_20890 [Caldilinea sp.]
MHTSIGKIVKSNSHIDYVCQVYGFGETPQPPAPEDYSFGAFVAAELETNGGGGATLVGLIYNTLLMNPEFGSLGPRLSPRNEVEIFSPDYLAETATLLGVIGIGWFDMAGRAHQGVPALAATVNCPVRLLGDDEVSAFHADAGGQPQLRYAPQLLAQNHALVAPLLLSVIDRLGELFPASRSRLTVMRNNVAWKSIVQPAG